MTPPRSLLDQIFFSARVLFLVSLVAPLHANISSDAVVDLQATVADTSPCITLSWTLHGVGITGQSVYRRLKGATGWGTALATLSTTATSYADTTALPNVEYEYWMRRTFSATPYTAIGYISAGDKVAEVHARGTLLLVVDDTMVTPLASEIAQLRDDLSADGWSVQQITAPRTGTAITTKALIKAAYDADPTQVKMVYLLGRVPVPYSGFYINPDGHGSRAFPADGYYADMNGTWTDATTYSGGINSPRGDNVAGDGKFDQDYFPTTLELQVGRVDMANLTEAPSSATSETSLLRRYLRKAHDFRYKQGAYAAVPRRSLIYEGFASWGEAFAANGWATAYTCVTPSTTVPSAIDQASVNQWFTSATANSYLTGHINGSGGVTSFQGGGESFEFGRKPSKVVFPSAFGSYSDDWDYTNSVMRAMLAGNASGDSLALTCYWDGRPHYFTHQLGMGETFGYAIRTSQNANISGGGGYTPGGYSFGGVHVGLLGDPALRLHMVEPPRNLLATSAGSQVTLSWSASTETGLQGYHVYRAATSAGPFTKLTTTPQAGTSYTDSTGTPGQSYAYMVRTLKLETVPGGSYYNLSHGALATLTVNDAATAAPLNPTNLAVTQTSAVAATLTWTDQSSDETGFRIERKSSADGAYASIGTVGSNATTFSDPGPFTQGTAYYYRVFATGSAGDSLATNEASFEVAAGTIDFQALTRMKVSRAVGTAQIPVERFGGVTGAITANYTTSDSSAISGTHFTGGNGTLSWADGESGIKYISIPITNNATPQQARQFVITLSSPTGGSGLGIYKTMRVCIEDSAATLPGPWLQTNISDDGSHGLVSDTSPAVSAEGAIGSTMIGGGGLDIAQSWETGRFIYQTRTGDGVLTAYIPNTVPKQTAARFALMVRDTIFTSSAWQSPMAATVTTFDTTLGSKFHYRVTQGASSTIVGAANTDITPRWLRLSRVGNVFTSYSSSDGTTWTTIGSATIALAATTNWGLFHISQGTNYDLAPQVDYQLATFQNVTLTPEMLAPASSAWLGDAAGDWNNPANWASGTYTNGAGQIATFDYNITAARIITLNGLTTVGGMVLNDPDATGQGTTSNLGFNISLGANNLTLDAGTAGYHPSDLVLISIPATNKVGHTFSNGTGKLILTDNVQFDVNANVEFSMGNALLSGAGSLLKTGSGTLLIAGANSAYSGNIRIEGGTLQARNNATAFGTGTITWVNTGGMSINNFGSGSTPPTFANNLVLEKSSGSSTPFGMFAVNTPYNWSGNISSLTPGAGDGVSLSVNFDTTWTNYNSGRAYNMSTFSGDNSGLKFDASHGFLTSDSYLGVGSANALGLGNNALVKLGAHVTSQTGILATVTGLTIASPIMVAGTTNQTAVVLGSTVTSGTVTYTGPITLNYNTQSNLRQGFLRAETGSTVVFTSVIGVGGASSGAYLPLAKIGGGRVELNSASTYLSNTAVRSGELVLGNATALGGVTNVTTVNLGEVTPVMTSVRVATIGSTSSGTFAADVTYNGTFTAAPTSVDGITLAVGDRILIKDNGTQNGIYVVQSSGTWVRATDLTTTAQMAYGQQVAVTSGTINGGSVYFQAQRGSSVYPGTMTLNTSPLDYHKDILNPSVSLLVNGALNISRDIAVVANGSTGKSILGGANTTGTSIFSGAITLARDLTVTAASGGNVDFTGGLSGGFGVTKEGAGKAIFSTSKTYTGATSVAAGVLAVNSTLASSGVTVASGATLQGVGTITNGVTVTGTLSPGNSLGNLTVGSASFATGGVLAVEVDGTGAGSADRLSVTGNLNIAQATLNLSVLTALHDPVYIIASYGSLTGTFASVVGLPAGYALNYAYNGGTQIAIVTGYSNWVAGFGGDFTDTVLTSDPDGDSLNNLIEYAFGLNPTTPNAASALPQPTIQGSQWNVSYTGSAIGVTYGAEWSTNLQTWTPLTDLGSGSTHTYSIPLSGQSKLFFRHRITLPP